MDSSRWEWLDSAAGAVAGVFTGVATFYGIFAKRMSDVDESIVKLKSTDAEQGMSIAILETHHTAKMQRLERMEDNLQAINEKQDRQMEILLDLSKR